MASRSRFADALCLVSALLVAGCAENAILQIDIVPPSTEAAHTLAVQVGAIDADETAVTDLGTEVYQFPLANLESDPTHLSVEARGEEAFATPVGIAVWTCQEEG